MKHLVGILIAWTVLGWFASVWSLTQIASNPVRIYDTDYPGWFIYQLDPGDTITDTVRFTNVSTQPQRARIYISDYIQTGNSGFGVKNFDDSQNMLGSWTTLSQDELLLQGRKSILVNFTIRLPSDAPSQPIAGGIMIEMLDVDTGERLTTINEDGVAFSYRSGTRIYNFPSGTSWNNPIVYDPSTTPSGYDEGNSGSSTGGGSRSRYIPSEPSDSVTPAKKPTPSSNTQPTPSQGQGGDRISEDGDASGQSESGSRYPGGSQPDELNAAGPESIDESGGTLSERDRGIMQDLKNMRSTIMHSKGGNLSLGTSLLILAGLLVFVRLIFIVIRWRNWRYIDCDGDTSLEGLAQTYATSVSTLMKKNKIKTDDQLRTRKKILVPIMRIK